MKIKQLLLVLIILFSTSYAAIAKDKKLTQSKANSSTSIKTSLVKYVGIDSAICGGKIYNPNSETILSAGVCWSTNPNPTTSDSKAERSVPSDSFVCILNTLMPKQAYYVKAFVVTNSGTYYGPQRTFATDPIKLGAFVKGGQLVYVLQPGDPGYVPNEFHGLVGLFFNNLNDRLTWSNGIDTFINATDTALFTGQINTQKIVSVLGEGSYAAKFCYDLVANGYSDWYLPSKLEARVASKTFKSTIAWTSTEVSKANALQLQGIRYKESPKNTKLFFCAIRKF